MNDKEQKYDYAAMTAGTVREFARGLAEHLNASADQLVGEVRAMSERNLREAEHIQARCRQFAEDMKEQAETIAQSNEAIFERMTKAGKAFANTIDQFSESVALVDRRPRPVLPSVQNAPAVFDVAESALDAVDKALSGGKE